ncbi:MAG: sugar phosphate nucleotidyltransferase [Comamonadaceae bacterium]|nr:sugar phosphate nucleotidyltransferase [Comamonadaceae bacterium]
MPVYDKPMIYYPVATLMLAAIRDILVITTPRDQRGLPEPCWATAVSWGVNFQYAVQPSPDGLAQAFLIGERVHRRRSGLPDPGRQHLSTVRACRRCCAGPPRRERGATVFGYYVTRSRALRRGRASMPGGRAVAIEEKPAAAAAPTTP